MQRCAVGAGQHHCERLVRLVELVLTRLDRDVFYRVAGRKDERTGAPGVVRALGRCPAGRLVAYRHRQFARGTEPHREARRLTLLDSRRICNGEARHVVVFNRPGCGVALQRCAVGTGQRHRERLVRLVERVLARRHQDGLLRIAGRKGERAGGSGVVRAFGRRPAGRLVVHCHRLIARGTEPYREARRLTLLDSRCIRDGKARHVVVFDRPDRRVVLQRRAVGVAQRDRERLVRLVERVLTRLDRDVSYRVAGRKGERAGGSGVVRAFGRRPASRLVVHRHRLIARCAERHCEACRLALNRRRILDGEAQHAGTAVAVSVPAAVVIVFGRRGRGAADVDPHASFFVYRAIGAIGPHLVGDRNWPGRVCRGIYAYSSPLLPLVWTELDLPAYRGHKAIACVRVIRIARDVDTYHDPPWILIALFGGVGRGV